MLALPVSRCALSIAKFCVLTFYLFMEMVVFLVVFVIAGLIATQTMEVTETLPILYLLKWCLGLFLTMLPCIAAMWAITVLFEKPLLSVGLNLLLVIPRCIGCEYAAVDRLPVLLQRLSRFLLSP